MATKKGKSYYAVFKQNGKQDWIPLKTRYKEEAEQRHAQLKRERNAERFGLPKSPEDISWPDLIKEFLRHKGTNGLAKETLARNRIVLGTAERVLGLKFASDVTAQKIERFKQLRVEAGIAASTVNRELVTLKDCLRSAKAWGYRIPPIHEVDAVKKIKNPRRHPLFFTTEQIAELLDGVEPTWRIAILLGALQGLRRGEVLNLRWQDLDFEKRQLRVTDREDWRSKTRRSRTLPLYESLVEPLKAWKTVCGDSPMVMPWNRTPVDFTRDFTKLLRRKGFTKGTFHTLRHSFASNLAREDVNLKKISELLGHSSLSTTAIYAHIQPNDLAESIKKLPDPLVYRKPEGA